MPRFLFFVLLIANVAFGAHMYWRAMHSSMEVPAEINRDLMKVISITDSAKAQKDVVEAKKLVESLTGAACVRFSVKPADVARAQAALDTMLLGDRLTSKNVEEFTRFAVAIPPLRDRKAADTLLASLKKASVKDVSIMADNGISLGLFSTEEAAKRLVTDLEAKASTLVKGITITSKNPQIKETAFTVREPDANVIARVALLQRDFEASGLKGGDCDGAATAAVIAAPAAAAPPPVANAKR